MGERGGCEKQRAKQRSRKNAGLRLRKAEQKEPKKEQRKNLGKRGENQETGFEGENLKTRV